MVRKDKETNSKIDNSSLFFLDDEENIGEKKMYTAFELIYRLANKGIINLDHDEIEKNGVKVIL